MRRHSSHACAWLLLGLTLAALVGSLGWAFGQSGPEISGESWGPPVVPLLEDPTPGGSAAPEDPAARASRFPLFRMPAAFPTDPLGLNPDNNSARADSAGDAGDAGGVGRINVAFGSDNPYLDFRLPGDPGGIGYYRLDGQVLLANTRRTCLSFALRGVTPAGLEENGVASGPTYVSPALALYQDLGAGVAVHGFVGEDFRPVAAWPDDLGRNFRFGLALQAPLDLVSPGSGQRLHVFVEALGTYQFDLDGGQGGLVNYQLLPGLHWQAGDHLWMSGGFILPLGTPAVQTGLWQLTCSWNF